MKKYRGVVKQRIRSIWTYLTLETTATSHPSVSLEASGQRFGLQERCAPRAAHGFLLRIVLQPRAALLPGLLEIMNAFFPLGGRLRHRNRTDAKNNWTNKYLRAKEARTRTLAQSKLPGYCEQRRREQELLWCSAVHVKQQSQWRLSLMICMYLHRGTGKSLRVSGVGKSKVDTSQNSNSWTTTLRYTRTMRARHFDRRVTWNWKQIQVECQHLVHTRSDVLVDWCCPCSSVSPLTTPIWPWPLSCHQAS